LSNKSPIAWRSLKSVIDFVTAHGGVTARQISDGLHIDFSYASRIAKEMTDQGIFDRLKVQRGYKYSIHTDDEDPAPRSNESVLEEAKRVGQLINQATDLMDRGFYRRADTLLAEALHITSMPGDFDEIRRLRTKCWAKRRRYSERECESYTGNEVNLPVNGFYKN